MKRLDRSRAVAFIWAAILDIIVIGVLIILHERDTALKALLDRITGHHWVTKSLMTCVLFPGLAFLFYRALGRRPAPRSEGLAFWAAALSTVTALFFLGTIAFFVLEYFT